MASVVINIISAVTLVLAYGGAILGVFCLVDAAIRRPSAFTAAGKHTKAFWLLITALSGLVLVMPVISPVIQPQGLLWLAALIGALVYLVDVRPNVKDGPRRSSW